MEIFKHLQQSITMM